MLNQRINEIEDYIQENIDVNCLKINLLPTDNIQYQSSNDSLTKGQLDQIVKYLSEKLNSKYEYDRKGQEYNNTVENEILTLKSVTMGTNFPDGIQTLTLGCFYYFKKL